METNRSKIALEAVNSAAVRPPVLNRPKVPQIAQWRPEGATGANRVNGPQNGLYDSLGVHGVGQLLEGGDIGAHHVIAFAAVFLGGKADLPVNVHHDLF